MRTIRCVPSANGMLSSWTPAATSKVCEVFPLSDRIHISEVDPQWRRPASGPFGQGGVVKQGYLWPMEPGFAEYLRGQFAERWPAGWLACTLHWFLLSEVCDRLGAWDGV